jgi:hypothetical protein
MHYYSVSINVTVKTPDDDQLGPKHVESENEKWKINRCILTVKVTCTENLSI